MIDLRSHTANGDIDEGGTTVNRKPGPCSNSYAISPLAGLADADDTAAFAEQLLAALTGMAARSKRGQADVTAALRGAAMAAEPRQVRAALRLLHAQGSVENFVPLSDGGLLLSVIRKTTGHVDGSCQWLPFDEPRP